MSFISDIANFKPPAKNFGRMAILAIAFAIIYFVEGYWQYEGNPVKSAPVPRG